MAQEITRKNVKLVIFDMDYTLMNWVGGGPKLYVDVESVLEYIKEKGIKMAIASYNINPMHFLKKFGIEEYFDFIATDDAKDIMNVDYKKSMLKRILEHYEIEPQEAVFFDDQPCNILTAERLGIKSHLVDMNSGVNLQDVIMLV